MKRFLITLLLLLEFFFATHASATSFKNLDEALYYYRKMESSKDWAVIPNGPKLEKGMLDEHIAIVRKHLWLTGYLENKPVKDKNFFDADLENAIRLFQKQHGLTIDGVVGSSTREALNVPVSTLIHQLEANIEREKETEPISEKKYILVNIPSYHLDYFENGEPALSLRIVVGKTDWQTPAFSSKITGILFNPAWNIPQSIVKKEILPKTKKDPDYLSKEEIEVVDNRYQQKPGPKNPLGRIKFVMPNKFDIYLHDTPSKNFFDRPQRNLSHGCIRIEEPLELTRLLLQGNPHWTSQKIKETIDAGKEVTIPLPEPVSVYLIYRTAWIDKEGLLQIRPDIYKKDE